MRRIIIALSLLPVCSAFADELNIEGVKVNGFVDAQGQWASDASMTKGFVVNDGALYLSRSEDAAEFKVDLPFRMLTSSSSHFEFARYKAQAYVAYDHGNGFKWKLGQFDTFFGFETNDSIDTPFSRLGNVNGFFNPTVHTGFQPSYEICPHLTFNGVIGNPHDAGILTGKNPEFGGQFAFSGDFRASLGGMTNRDSARSKMSWYYDATLGVTRGKLAVDAEAAYIKNSTDAKAAWAYLLQLMYSATDRWSMGTRGELITLKARKDPNYPGTTYPDNSVLPTLDQQILVFVGPQYQLTKRLRLKADYVFQSDRAVANGTSRTTHGGNIAAVFKF